MRYLVMLAVLSGCHVKTPVKTNLATHLPPSEATPYCFIVNYHKEIVQACFQKKRTCKTMRGVTSTSGRHVVGINMVSGCMRKADIPRRLKRLHRLECKDRVLYVPILIRPKKRWPFDEGQVPSGKKTRAQ